MIAPVRLAALPLMSLALGTLLSCRQATQITVNLRGEGFACQPSASEPGYSATGVLARAQLTGAGDLAGPRADGGDDDCKGAEPVDLGSVVLVPQTGVGPVEVLAVAALRPIEGAAPSVDECLDAYQAFLAGETEGCAPTEPCAACIFARRSLGFVEYSNLDLTISLDNDCAGVLCEASKTCVPERGCVSAVVECNDESCGEPVGSGGGDPVGGSGGGGESTGGGPPAVWEELPLLDGVPMDVVARSETHSNQLVLVTYVAAGDRLARYEGREPIDQVVGPTDAYIAVAVEESGLGVATLGAEGVALGPGFAPSGPAMTGYVDFDIAFKDGAAAPIAAVDRGPGQPCTMGVQSLPVSQCGVAVFAAGSAPEAQLTVVADTGFGADTPSQYILELSVPTYTSTDWSLWSHAVSAGADGELTHGYAVPDETVVRRFWLDDMDKLLHTDVISLASSPLLNVKIDAIWGVARDGGVDLFAVGELDGKGWLGRAEILDGAATFDGWFSLSLPTGIRTLRSIWVGPDPQLGDALVVVIAGSKQGGEPYVAVTELSGL